MRNRICLLALVLLLAPFAAHAAGTSSGPLLVTTGTADPGVALRHVPAAAPTASPQVQGFLDFLAVNSAGTGRQIGKVCSISCRSCVVSCPPGEGVCFHGAC